MGGAFFKVPELVLTHDEAQAIADAAKRVTDLYYESIIPEKALAWIQLSITACGVYGPRYVAIQQRTKRAAQPQAIPFPSSFPPGATVTQ
jgi:hypothetical protein